ncbi:MAG TPA: hypothetical protein VIO64_19430 [Pseudobacteroides sp.]
MTTPSSYWDVVKSLVQIQRQLPTIQPVDREQYLPLAYPQQRM